ncbi:MAG: Smr/MutS family protein [Nitrospinae bacterium]|nr:Smr/MutS family protein [Nitrospinota bacterium]
MAGEKTRVMNIKEGMPTVDEARRRLIRELERAKKDGVKVVKIIHGYGSTGVGGKIKDGVRKSLRRRKSEGVINLFVYGENWSVFDADTREILERCPALSRERDIEGNEGVTVVLL